MGGGSKSFKKVWKLKIRVIGLKLRLQLSLELSLMLSLSVVLKTRVATLAEFNCKILGMITSLELKIDIFANNKMEFSWFEFIILVNAAIYYLIKIWRH